ncbi:MAG: filamentous hemagglutinin N-terminal domain-containing protein [Victivallales bacterium]|nr:filamentous hemagglutinin N-terminal domain-containing protein [Victivallales bacterium]
MKSHHDFGRFLRYSCLGASALVFGLFCQGRELPSGATVVHGKVEMSVQGQTMFLEQGTARAIVNWDSFDIGKGCAVTIRQPTAQASMLARVTGTSPSEIFGRLTANGGFYLVNPNGILFGSGAVVDVNRLLATTRCLSDQDFLEGRLRLVGESEAVVENSGIIQAESMALVAQTVQNHGVIQSAQSAMLGVGETVTLQNFENGARLMLDFSGLGGEATRVENNGTIDAPGGRAVLSAAGGAGQVWSAEGRVTAQEAEFSGRNSALSQLGEVHADELIIDPTANLVIGNATAADSGLGYGLIVAGVGAEELELPVSDAQPEFTEGVGYGFHDADGNGWTYMRREANTLGGILDSYSYLDPVLTYYNAEYLGEKLAEQGITLNYTRRGTTDGNITLADQVHLGGNRPLTLIAESNLVVGSGVVSTNASQLTLQGERDVFIDDLTTAGELVITAGNQLASGHLEGTAVKLNAQNALVLSNGVKSLSGDMEMSGKVLKLGGELTSPGDIYIDTEQVIALSPQRLEAGEGVVVKGDWQVEQHPLDIISKSGPVQLDGEVRDASSVSVETGGSLKVSGIQSSGEVKLMGQNELVSNGDVIGSNVRLESSSGAVWVAGDLAAVTGEVVVSAVAELTSKGKVITQEATFTSGGDMMVEGTSDSSVGKLTLNSSGNDVQVELAWGADLPELVIETSGNNSSVVAEVGNVSSGCLEASGSGSSLELSGQAVCLQEATTVAGDIALTGTEFLTVGTVRSKDSGDVRLESGSDIVVENTLSAADDLTMIAGGGIVLETQEKLTSGGKMDLTAAEFGGGHTPLLVEVGGRLYVSGTQETADTSIFAHVVGRTGDCAIHTKGHRVPGLVIYNGRVWLGRPEQMLKVDRAESSLFSRICQMLRRE